MGKTVINNPPLVFDPLITMPELIYAKAIGRVGDGNIEAAVTFNLDGTFTLESAFSPVYTPWNNNIIAEPDNDYQFSTEEQDSTSLGGRTGGAFFNFSVTGARRFSLLANDIGVVGRNRITALITIRKIGTFLGGNSNPVNRAEETDLVTDVIEKANRGIYTAALVLATEFLPAL